MLSVYNLIYTKFILFSPNYLNNKMPKKLPLLIILGSTGTGKTKLSIELAKKFSGEIIGADSMQIYKGLDIITAKVSKSEQKLIPHHMIDILEPNEMYTVLEYRNKALPIINNLIEQNKLPIVVGGTNYYIESILWKILVESSDSEIKFKPFDDQSHDFKLPSVELHKKLQILDPKMAARLHPNNKRKILRSLEVLYHKGKRHSDILEEQQSSKGGSKSGGALRYPNSLILWIQCEKDVLDERLNSRVDNMLKEGLIKELETFQLKYQELSSCEEEYDFTKGIFQSIGFKEFNQYFNLSENDRNSTEGKKVFHQCVEELKMVTRRYAKKQIKWISNRFLGRSDREVPAVFALDSTDPSKWETNVLEKALSIVDSSINNKSIPYERLKSIEVISKPNSNDETFYCKICERVFVGDYQTSIHLKSNRHKKRLESISKLKKKNESIEIIK